jgi:hypothetical protein
MQATAVRRMLQQGCTILVAQERANSKRTYKSFVSLDRVQRWLSNLSDTERNVYMVDLSAWSNPVLSPDEQHTLTSSYVSPLVCDVEWLSSDHLPDPLAQGRIATLRVAIGRGLTRLKPLYIAEEEEKDREPKVRIHIEDLSRLPKGKHLFKNSFHLIAPSAVFEHNAEGCMKDFVLKVLVPEMHKYQDMLWVETTTNGDQCIVDLGIYTRSRQLRMPGCCKYGGFGRPAASLSELNRMRSSFFVPDLEDSTRIITEEMIATVVSSLKGTIETKKKRKPISSSSSSSSINNNNKKQRVHMTSVETQPCHRYHTTATEAYCNELTKMIRSGGDCTSHVIAMDNYYKVVSLHGPRVCVCDLTGRTTHQHNTAKLTVDQRTGEVWFFCHSLKCPNAVLIGQLIKNNHHQMEEEGRDIVLPPSSNSSSSSSSSSSFEYDADNGIVVPDGDDVTTTIEDNRQYIDITKRYITDDTRLDLTHEDGRHFALTWHNKMLLARTPQNTGKTRWSNQLVERRRDCGTTVLVSPLISLTHQTARQLQSVSGNLRVLHYKDGIRLNQTANLAAYDALVSTVFSLSHFTYPKDIATLILDEARIILSQILDWGGNDEQGGGGDDQRLDSQTTDRRRSHALKSRAILMGLGMRAKVLVALCAQITRLEVDLLLSLLGRPNTDVIELRMEHGSIPVTEVTEVQDLGRMIQRIITSVTSGQTVVVSCNVASFGRRLTRYIAADETLTRPDGTQINAVPWDSKWLAKEGQMGRNPAANMGQWIVQNNIHLVIHTTAVSPGMSIDGDGIVTQRYMVLLPYGADAMSMSQMADRVRKPVHRNLFIYSTRKPQDARIPSPQKDREHAIGVLLQRYPEEVQAYLPDGPEANLTDRMIPGPVNEYRLKRITERYLNKRCPLVQQVVDFMHNTRITDHDDAVTDLPDKWSQSLESAEETAGVKFFARDELAQIYKVNDKGDGTQYQRSKVYLHISEMVPPLFVRKKAVYTLGEFSLAPAAFRQIVSGNGYLKLCNFVSWVRLSGHNQGQSFAASLCRKMHPDDVPGRRMTDAQKVSRCVQSLLTLIGHDRVDAGLIVGSESVYASAAPSTDSGRKSAYEWMQSHWHIVTDLTTKKFRTKHALLATPEDVVSIWIVLLRNVLLTQLGLGCTLTNSGVTSSSSSSSSRQLDLKQKKHTVKIVLASFWKAMDIDIPLFVGWLHTARSKTHGPLSVVYVSCIICNGATSDKTECRLQGGIPLCFQHREVSEPLDTYQADAQQQLTWMQSEQQQLNFVSEVSDDEHEEKEEKEEKEEYIVDRLLRYVGFTDGRRSTNTMTHEQMKLAVTTSPNLTRSELAQVLSLYNIDIKHWNQPDDIKATKRQLGLIMNKDIHTTVKFVAMRQRQENEQISVWVLQ